ncbi:MAG: hypothetical protein RLZZ458_1859 [Planctomycetota bacterium]
MRPHHPLHPLCSIFPQMSDEEFDALRDDIEQHGQRDAIVLWDGQILDGRHRMQACLALGIEPKFRTVEMTWEEAKAYVLSVNLTRRHLDASQRAMIASRLATLEKGRPVASENGSIDTFSVTQQQAADSLNVGVAQVKRARKVREMAAPEVVAEVERGEMTLHKASKLAAAVPDKAEQAEIVKAGRVDEVLKKTLPPEEPPPLPRTNTLHTPATQQRMDRGPNPAPPTVIECGAGLTPLQQVHAQHTFDESLEDLTSGYEGEQAKRIARKLRARADELDPPEETKAPTLPQMRSIIEQRAKLPPADDRHLKPAVATAASEWAAHKISMPKAKRYQSRTSWEACLSRMATLSLDRGADVVCDMIQRAIASGYQGWEFETTAPRNGRQPMRSTNIRTGRNFDAEMGPPINLADVEEF